MSDDFCIDENAALLYLASHRENTVDCISMDLSRTESRPKALQANRSMPT